MRYPPHHVVKTAFNVRTGKWGQKIPEQVWMDFQVASQGLFLETKTCSLKLLKLQCTLFSVSLPLHEIIVLYFICWHYLLKNRFFIMSLPLHGNYCCLLHLSCMRKKCYFGKDCCNIIPSNSLDSFSTNSQDFSSYIFMLLST